MGRVSPRCRGHRVQDLLRAAGELPAVHLRLAPGPLYGAGFEAGKLPRRILPAWRTTHRWHLRCRLSGRLAQAQRHRIPSPLGEGECARPQSHFDGKGPNLVHHGKRYRARRHGLSDFGRRNFIRRL